MNSIFVTPGGTLSGEVLIPGDKSMTHRALLFSALAAGESEIFGGLASEDTLATAKILKALGVDCDFSKAPWRVRSEGLLKFRAPRGDLDCGNSGTTARLFLGLLCAQPFESRLVGDASLSRRPMERVLKPLEQMGGKFEATQGHLPIRVLPVAQDGLRSISYESSVASAQVKSACVLAALYAKGETSFTEPALSRDHTERMLGSRMKVRQKYLQKRHQVSVQGPVESLQPGRFTVAGDFSTAAFFLAAGALYARSELVLKTVGLNPTRLGLWDLLTAMGAEFEQKNQRIEDGEPVGDLVAKKAGILRSMNVAGDLTLRAIDELPIWSVAAARAQGRSVLSDAQELRVKESDRLAAIAENLRRLGVSVDLRDDGLSIEGRPQGLVHPAASGYGPGYLESFGDHRIAMAMAVAALGVTDAKQSVEIRDSQCVATSYPGFVADLKRLCGNQGVEEKTV